MHYFSYISQTLQFKNNLQKAVYGFLKGEERKVIPAEEVEAFKENILAEISSLNASYSRCQPVKATWYKFTQQQHDDTFLSGVDFCRFNLYASKK